MVTRSPNHCDFVLKSSFQKYCHLVGKLVGNDNCNIFLVAPRRLALFVQYCNLSVGYQTPVLHRSCAEVRDGNHVLLGQRERGVEVILVVREDLGTDLGGPFSLVVTTLTRQNINYRDFSSPRVTRFETQHHSETAEKIFLDGWSCNEIPTSDFLLTKSETTNARRYVDIRRVSWYSSHTYLKGCSV